MSRSGFPVLSGPAGTAGPRKTFSTLIGVVCCLGWQLFFFLALTGCSEPPHDFYQGYIEAEYLLVAAPLGGQLQSMAVSRGMTVAAGSPLFTLEHELESAAMAEAEQGVASAENRLADLTKGGRPSELAAIEARLEQARASHGLATLEYERRFNLVQQQTIPTEEFDRARSEKEQSAALVAQLTAELVTAGLGARADAIAVARAELEAARERLRQARWRLGQKSQAAPRGGLVYDTFYVEGEFVPVGYPVVSLLPPDNIKVRFFVPEAVVGGLTMGQRMTVHLDGASREYSATVSYISPQAEYTPPVIYSRETRTRLVYMVEAAVTKEDAVGLHPGQPVDVRSGAPNG